MIDLAASTRVMTGIRWAASLALLGIIGCNSDPDAAVKLVPVKGVVMLNGKPMANATVAFVPEAGGAGGTAGGDTTGPEGNYNARYRGRFGLAPGKYKVTITPGLAEAPAVAVSEAFKDDPFMAAELNRAAAVTKPAAKQLEIKGEFPAEVPPEGGTLDFDVKATASAAKSRSTTP